MAQPPRRKPVVGDWNRDDATEVLLMGGRAFWQAHVAAGELTAATWTLLSAAVTPPNNTF